MMKCKEYIFLLTSGQMKTAAPVVRINGFVHTTMCKPCRTFKANDQRLDGMLKDYREDLSARPDELS